METVEKTVEKIVTKARWPMSLEHIEKLRLILIAENKIALANGDEETRLIPAIDHAFRVGKYIESARDSDLNVWVVCKKVAPRDLTTVFKERNGIDAKRVQFLHWTEWFMFDYVPRYYQDSTQLTLDFFFRVLGGIHPLDAL